MIQLNGEIFGMWLFKEQDRTELIDLLTNSLT